MHESVQLPSGMKNEKFVHLYPVGTPQHFTSCICLLYFWVALTFKLLKIYS